MKTKHYGGYALFTATVVCNTLSISASAQDTNNSQTSPPGVSVASPAPSSAQPAQDATTSPASPQSPPFGRAGAPARDNTALPEAANPHRLDYQVQVGSPFDGGEIVSRHMLDRTRQILVLRRLLALRFSADDIAVTLPLLRRLNDIKAAPTVDPERALEDEYEALLSARPGDPLPPSSATKIVDAAHYYQDEQTKIWNEMARRLGRSKADGLYHLLGQSDRPISLVPDNRARRSQVGALPVAPGRANDFAPRATERRDALPDAPVGIIPPAARPGVSLSPVSPAAELPAPAAQGLSRITPDGRDDLPATAIPAPDRADAATPPAIPYGALPRGLAAPSTEYSLMVYSPTTVRISLAELIDLMQTKLSVMTKISK